MPRSREPFMPNGDGPVSRASGLGRELGPDAAEHFTETKNVFFAMDAS